MWRFNIVFNHIKFKKTKKCRVCKITNVTVCFYLTTWLQSDLYSPYVAFIISLDFHFWISIIWLWSNFFMVQEENCLSFFFLLSLFSLFSLKIIKLRGKQLPDGGKSRGWSCPPTAYSGNRNSVKYCCLWQPYVIAPWYKRILSCTCVGDKFR